MKKIFNKFNIVFNLWVSLVINVALCICLPLAAMKMITAAIFIKGFIIAYPVSTIFVLFVPVVPLGHKVAGALGAKQASIPFTMISTVILALLLGTPMSMLMTAVNAGTGPWFVAAWLSCYPIALLTVYLSALLGIWTGGPLTFRLAGPPPKNNIVDESGRQH